MKLGRPVLMLAAIVGILIVYSLYYYNEISVLIGGI